MLTDHELNELEAAEAKATPGPWEVCPGDSAILTAYIPKGFEFKHQLYAADLGKRMHETSAFIALARNNLKALIDELRLHRATAVAKSGLFDSVKRMVEVDQENQTLRAENEHLRKCMNNDKPAGLEQYILKVSENEKLRAQLEIAKEALKDMDNHWHHPSDPTTVIPKCTACEAIAKISGGGK